jgi:hypothetical protein
MKIINKYNINCLSGRYESSLKKIRKDLLNDFRDTVIVILILKAFNLGKTTIIVVCTYLILAWIYTIYNILKKYKI